MERRARKSARGRGGDLVREEYCGYIRVCLVGRGVWVLKDIVWWLGARCVEELAAGLLAVL